MAVQNILDTCDRCTLVSQGWWYKRDQSIHKCHHHQLITESQRFGANACPCGKFVHQHHNWLFIEWHRTHASPYSVVAKDTDPRTLSSRRPLKCHWCRTHFARTRSEISQNEALHQPDYSSLSLSLTLLLLLQVYISLLLLLLSYRIVSYRISPTSYCRITHRPLHYK
jgi:hypothetical protein